MNLRPPALLVAALQLWRKRRLQALLSTLGIAAGVAGLVLAAALGEGARREMEAALGGLGAGTLVVRHRSDAGGEPLTTVHQRRIVRLLGRELEGLAPLTASTLPVRGADARLDAVRVLATDRHYAALVPLPLRAGRFLADRDVAAGERVCVLGWELGRRLFPRGQVVGEPLSIAGEWFRVVGWLQPGALRLPGLGTLGLGGADQSLYVPLGALGYPGDGELDELLVRLHRGEALQPAMAAVRRVLAAGPGGKGVAAELIVPVEVLRQKHRLQRLFRSALLGVAGLMLAVGGIGIMNVMMVSVSARRAEIGLRRAVGATRRHILVQFLTESLVIAVAGGLAGIALGWGLALAVDLASPWTLAFSPGAALLGFAVSALAGVLFGTYPALRAAALSPVAALNDP
ncbi:MAG: ABC transporter permease [Porticoccaceae bacterium]|nr:ABC transporter permease [Porticoccaceae bacterium]HLS97751.1 ABC transporter permease [Porticoccaceae bacterium]